MRKNRKGFKYKFLICKKVLYICTIVYIQQSFAIISKHDILV